MSFARTLRSPGNHALSVIARMAEKDHPFARVNVPLSRGAIEPVDASKFRGVRFDVARRRPLPPDRPHALLARFQRALRSRAASGAR